jgi:hypothetical protein
MKRKGGTQCDSSVLLDESALAHKPGHVLLVSAGSPIPPKGSSSQGVTAKDVKVADHPWLTDPTFVETLTPLSRGIAKVVYGRRKAILAKTDPPMWSPRAEGLVTVDDRPFDAPPLKGGTPQSLIFHFEVTREGAIWRFTVGDERLYLDHTGWRLMRGPEFVAQGKFNK